MYTPRALRGYGIARAPNRRTGHRGLAIGDLELASCSDLLRDLGIILNHVFSGLAWRCEKVGCCDHSNQLPNNTMSKPWIIRDGRPHFVEVDEPPAVRAAGRPTVDQGDADETHGIGDGFPGVEQPGRALGGVGNLADHASSLHNNLGVAVAPNFPWTATGAHLATPVGDATMTDGGWLPNSKVPSGYRPGSAQWKQHAEQAAQQAAAAAALRFDRQRSERFFSRQDDERRVERAREEEHMRQAVLQAARAVDRKHHLAANSTYVHVPHAPAQGHAHELGQPWSSSVHSKEPAVGYRPGSAAARRAAGGLYAPPVGALSCHHSNRLNAAAVEHVLQQEAASARTVARRADQARAEQQSIEDAYERIEGQGTIAMRSADHEFMAHAERVATRKTLNMAANTALAPAGRLGRARPGSFDRGHVYAVL